MTREIGPDYRILMNEIRDRITSGKYRVGQQIPSTTALVTETGMSLTVVRRAVQQLQDDGVLEGHPGKGVFVAKVPADADAERKDLKTLAEQLTAVRESVGRLEANLIELYGKTGHAYPEGGSHDGQEAAAPRRRRSSR